MEELLNLLIPAIIIGLFVINAIVRAKKAASRKPEKRSGEDGEWTYVAEKNQLKGFLEQMGIAPPGQGRPPGGAKGGPSRPVVPPRQGARPTGVVPTARRGRGVPARGAAGPAPRETWPPEGRAPIPKPPPVGQPGATRRRVADADAVAAQVPPAAPAGAPQKPAEGFRENAPTEARPQVPGAKRKAQRTGIRAKARRISAGAGKAPTEPAAFSERRSFQVPALDVGGLKQAIVLSEILGPPVALRGDSGGGGGQR